MSTYWKFLRDWHWLARRFGEYELVYLDPLVCDLLVSESWRERILPPELQSPKTPEETFLKQLTEALSEFSKKDLESSLKRGELGATQEAERALQKQVAKVVDQYLPWRRSYMVAQLQKGKKDAIDWADKKGAESLVLVEGVFARRAAAPESLQGLIDSRYPDEQNPHRRSIEGMILEIPVPVATLDQPFLGLMVDTTAFYRRASMALMRTEWYPFVRILGLYSTSPNGHPFLNVIGILAPPHPTLDEVLDPTPGELSWHSLRGVLNYTKESILEPEIGRLDAELTSLGANKPPPGRSYKRFYELLCPLFVLLGCCKLNGVDWEKLQSGAPDVASTVKDYVDKLHKIIDLLDRLDMTSPLRRESVDAEKLLVPPFALP